VCRRAIKRRSSAQDAAFLGTVLKVIRPDGDLVSSADPQRYVFEVQDVFKGEVTSPQTVVTAREGGSCGLALSGPGPFVVFATHESTLTHGARGGELYSHLCSGTRSLAEGGLAARLREQATYRRIKCFRNGSRRA
jgi:hypothetical protein